MPASSTFKGKSSQPLELRYLLIISTHNSTSSTSTFHGKIPCNYLECLTPSILWEWDIQPYWEWPVLLCQTRLINTSTNSKVDWCIHLSRMMSWPRGPFKKSIITVHFIVVIQRDIIRSVKLTNCPNEGLYKIDQYSPWINQLLTYSVNTTGCLYQIIVCNAIWDTHQYNNIEVSKLRLKDC